MKQTTKKRFTSRDRSTSSETVEEVEQPKKQSVRDLSATDELLNEMDLLLENTQVAEGYVQKGGQ